MSDRRNQFEYFLVVIIAGVLLVTLSGMSYAQNIEFIHYGTSSHGDAWRAYVEEKAQEFMKANPGVTIDILVQPASGYIDGYLVMAASGHAPDISEFNDRDGGQLQHRGLFLDLRPYLEDSDIMHDFLPLSLSAFTWTDGVIWGFPVDSGPNITLFNKELFDLIGHPTPDSDPERWTWEEAKRAAARLTIDRDGDGAPDQWGMTNINRMWQQSTTVCQAGGHLFDRVVNPTASRFDSLPVLQGLEFLVELNNMGVVAPTRQFTEGRVGINVTVGPSWIESQFGTRVGGAPWEWGMAPPLLGPDNRGTLVFTNAFQISSQSKHPDVAMKWIEFLVGSREASDEFVRRTGRISANSHSLPVFAEHLGLTQNMLEIVGETMSDPNSFPNYSGPRMNDMRELSNAYVQTRVFERGENPQNVLLDLHAQISAILAEVQAE